MKMQKILLAICTKLLKKETKCQKMACWLLNIFIIYDKISLTI